MIGNFIIERLFAHIAAFYVANLQTRIYELRAARDASRAGQIACVTAEGHNGRITMKGKFAKTVLGCITTALAATALALPASAKDIRFTLGEYSANTKVEF